MEQDNAGVVTLSAFQVRRENRPGGATQVIFPIDWQKINRGEGQKGALKFTSIPAGEEVHLAELPIPHQHRLFTDG